MRVVILGLLAETSIHPGMGRSTGTVDLPVSREAATDYPVIFGSGVKGAMRDKACQEWQDESGRRLEKDVEFHFGKQEEAGNVIVSDARLVLLPVRSLSGQYRWLTCPHLLERYQRDSRRGGLPEFYDLKALTGLADGKALGSGQGKLFLEERLVEIAGPVSAQILDALTRLVPHEETAERLGAQVLVVTDKDFAWFARYALQVNARNVLTDKKTSENLWYEESLPPDSLFSCMLMERRPAEGAPFAARLFEKRPYIQMGGNETVGQGWFAVKTVGA